MLNNERESLEQNTTIGGDTPDSNNKPDKPSVFSKIDPGMSQREKSNLLSGANSLAKERANGLRETYQIESEELRIIVRRIYEGEIVDGKRKPLDLRVLDLRGGSLEAIRDYADAMANFNRLENEVHSYSGSVNQSEKQFTKIKDEIDDFVVNSHEVRM